ncbi:MAG: amidohydrolase [Pseudomonadales bacterium]
MSNLKDAYSHSLSGFLFCLLVLAACSQTGLEKTPAADWLLHNGLIYTADKRQPWAELVVIKDGKYVYVGNRQGLPAAYMNASKITDLAGRMVIPGMVDSHTHPGQINLIQFDATFDARDRKSFIAELESYAAANQGDDWLLGCCWPTIEFVTGKSGPDREDLDRIFPNRPVWINSNAGHSFWLNSRALEKLGLNAESKDPKFPIAMYNRDESDRLTGWIKEGAGWQLMDEVFPVDQKLHEASIRDMLRVLSEHGVTTVFDAGNKDFNDRVYSFLHTLDEAGELPLRYEGTFRISTPDRLQLGISEMKRFRTMYAGNRLRFNTIKLFMDGVHENRSGAQLNPYADNPDHVSDTTVSVAQLRDYLIQLHSERFDLHVHVIGDMASRRVLDAVELAKAAVGEDFYPRVSVAHVQNTNPSDWPRFAELDVSANFTPWWMGLDDPDPIAEALGPKRANDTYRAKAIADAGGNVTFSSDDWTLDVLSPFLGMQVGHTRQYPREWQESEQNRDGIRLPLSEKLPLKLLLQGYTINGAYQLRMEDEIGSIAVGKAADMVVLKDHLFEVDPYELHQTKPTAVIMEGELIQGIMPQ